MTDRVLSRVVAGLGWNDGAPQPRLWQLGFTLLVGAALALRALDGRPIVLASWPMTGFVLVAACAALLVATAHITPPPALTTATAVLDIAALGMLADGADTGGASPLVVLPAIWLGVALGVRGGLVAVGATFACLTGPGLIAHGLDPETFERLAILPLIAAVGAVGVAAALAAARQAQARAEAGEAALAQAMSVIENDRHQAEAVFDAVDIGLSLFGADGAPVLVNQRMDQLARLTYPDGLNDICLGWVFDESGSTRLSFADGPTGRACTGEEFDNVRIWIGQQPTERRALSVSARSVAAADGTVVGAAVSYSDVTDYMRALQVKDEFIALVSHELRTPLTSILGYVALISERDDLDPVLGKHLDAVARNAHRLHRLIDDLLDDVQRPVGPVAPADRGTDLADLVRSAVAKETIHSMAAGVHVQVEAPASLPYAGDPQRLSRAVGHLISNAVKCSEPGGRVLVRLSLETAAVVIQVADDGIGIAPEECARIFERFYRTGEADRRALQGAGLGLTVARAVAASHGGVIEVDSEPGVGSEFRMVLPLRVDALAS